MKNILKKIIAELKKKSTGKLRNKLTENFDATLVIVSLQCVARDTFLN